MQGCLASTLIAQQLCAALCSLSSYSTLQPAICLLLLQACPEFTTTPDAHPEVLALSTSDYTALVRPMVFTSSANCSNLPGYGWAHGVASECPAGRVWPILALCLQLSLTAPNCRCTASGTVCLCLLTSGIDRIKLIACLQWKFQNLWQGFVLWLTSASACAPEQCCCRLLQQWLQSEVSLQQETACIRTEAAVYVMNPAKPSSCKGIYMHVEAQLVPILQCLTCGVVFHFSPTY